MVRTSNISDAVASPVFLGQESKPELVKKVQLISPNQLLLSPQASAIVRDEPPSEVSDIGGIFYTIYTSYPEHVGNFLEILHMSDGCSAKYMFIQMRNIFAFFRDELVYSQALQSWAFVKIAYLVQTLLLAGARLLSN